MSEREGIESGAADPMSRSIAVAVAAFAWLCVLGMPYPAAADATLVGSDPADGSTVRSDELSHVSVRFNEPVFESAVQLVVTDAGGDEVSHGEPVVDGHRVSRPLHVSEPGAYTIAYRITSADGHPVDGTITFDATVGRHSGEPGGDAGTDQPSGEAKSTGESAPSSTSSDDGAPLWPWLVGGAAVIVAGGGFLVRRRPTIDVGAEDVD